MLLLTGYLRLGSALRAFICALAFCIPTSSNAATFLGEFWDASSGFNNLNQAISFAENNVATATFQSTGIDYPSGNATTISSSSTLATFLGIDAASIIGNAAATIETSVFRISGFVDLLPGTQQFAVGSDDGYRLTIDGNRVSQQNRPRGYGTTTRNRNPGEGRVAFELFFYENFGSTGLTVLIDGQVAQASPVPLPAGLSLIATALAALGLLKWRRRSFPLGKPA